MSGSLVVSHGPSAIKVAKHRKKGKMEDIFFGGGQG